MLIRPALMYHTPMLGGCSMLVDVNQAVLCHTPVLLGCSTHVLNPVTGDSCMTFELTLNNSSTS